MGRRTYSKAELLELWKKMEEKRKEETKEHEKVKEPDEPKVELVTKCCKNCANGFYRYIPPTGTFTEPSEFAGCRLHAKVVNPYECCQNFKHQ